MNAERGSGLSYTQSHTVRVLFEDTLKKGFRMKSLSQRISYTAFMDYIKELQESEVKE